MNSPAQNLGLPKPHERRAPSSVIRHSSFAFSLVELLVTMTLLSLIILALMAVFSSTQRAFRASVTQTDILEGSRAAMDMITADLRTMVASYSSSNYNRGVVYSNSAVNFSTVDNNFFAYYPSLYYQPLLQSLPGSASMRTNVLNYFFLLGRQNTKWTAVGYVVNPSSTQPLYPLYRFYAEQNISISPYWLYAAFSNTVARAQWTNMSHVLDGVVHLAVRPYDRAGYWMTTNIYYPTSSLLASNVHNNVRFVYYSGAPPTPEVAGSFFFSNAVPAAVELQLGVIEDRTLARTESLGNWIAQSNYLAQQSGHVHLFRQRVTIPNVDPTAYLPPNQ